MINWIFSYTQCFEIGFHRFMLLDVAQGWWDDETMRLDAG